MKLNYHYIAIEGSAQTQEEAITLCAKALYHAGYVEEGFAADCVERERNYPTGICTDIPVAIPHCQSPAIKENAVCYLRLKKPIEFGRMDDDEETIQTRSIFNLAIKKAGDHLDFLNQMMGVVTNQALLEQLESADIGTIPALLRKSLEGEA